MTVLPDSIKEIIVNRLRGAMTPEEEKVLDEWRRQQPAHEAELARYDAVWDQSAEILRSPDFDVARAWQRVDQRLMRSVEEEDKQGRTVMIWKYLKGGIAAAAAAVAILAGWQLFHKTDKQVTWRVATADTANRYVRLPDSSLVLLRKGATITYSSAFGNRDRQVALIGDAFFDIAPNEKLPFRVQTERSLIKVLGTSFVVNTTTKSDRVVVMTGKIMFSDKAAPENQCVVSAKEDVSFTGKSFEKRDVTDSNCLSWQTGVLQFTNTPLQEVIRDLSSYYGTTVKLNDTLKMGAVKVTASFRGQPLNEVLEEITVITGLHYRKQEDNVINIY
ncbi:MAG TPA: FecR domain-containing protein [Chitinophaga sp.]|uniref:FecR domain-containing protein n=1 Tax=Chitinophaga sp. TaxID=1869181 RepID=UPI002C647AE1|nr:FecR domain-containing protein [Chitinophaga sp.]HVI45723.1 FecR domain-containing protein [Chitinophaga sp.]